MKRQTTLWLDEDKLRRTQARLKLRGESFVSWVRQHMDEFLGEAPLGQRCGLTSLGMAAVKEAKASAVIDRGRLQTYSLGDGELRGGDESDGGM